MHRLVCDQRSSSFFCSPLPPFMIGMSWVGGGVELRPAGLDARQRSGVLVHLHGDAHSGVERNSVSQGAILREAHE
ncbi:hypothetical protein DCE94_05885 [Agromyces badenianii]|nr:hypothetical protein DCE94_05885 [Agromyces badenianii]